MPWAGAHQERQGDQQERRGDQQAEGGDQQAEGDRERFDQILKCGCLRLRSTSKITISIEGLTSDIKTDSFEDSLCA